jgi:hypothetical protein
MQEISSTKYSFLEIISKSSIVIPPLQRDYAQGRKSEEDKLEKFVEFLKNSLDENKKVNLDFIFGYHEENKIMTSFIPIDGQQRLTTIFLVHWFTAIQTENYSLFKNVMLCSGESKFTYKTRVSSQEFISSIIQNEIHKDSLTNSKESISEILENCGWFYKPWKDDSTVQSILNALNVIQRVFKDAPNLDKYYSKLSDGLVTFEFLNPEAIELSDEFYIKMNARGLSLSQFENFKADLLDTLQKKFPLKKKEFSHRLDGDWSDAIWNWSRKSENTYDNCFSNVFNFIFQICFSKSENLNSESKYSMTRHYKELLDVNALEFISKTFDFIVNLDNYIGAINIRLFDTYLELFKSKDISHLDKLKVYGLFQYQLKFGIKLDNDTELLDLDRIINNVLSNINQSQKRKFISDLRTSRYKELIQFIDELISQENPYEALAKMKHKNNVISHEINKANRIVQNPEIKEDIQKLEDHEYLKGCLNNFLFLFDDKKLAKRNVDVFYKLWNVGIDNDLFLYRVLFSFGDYEVDVGGSGLGRVYFVGGKGKWHRVLANTNKESTDQIEVFKKLYNYIGETELDGISKKLESVSLPELNIWRYYLASYPEILKDHDLFAYNEDEVQLAQVELLKGSILSTHHTGYLNRAVVLEIDRQGIELSEDIRSYSNSVNWSSLQIGKNNMVFNGTNWLITTKLNILEDDDFDIENFESEENRFIINSSEQDLVQLMVSFIKKYFSKKSS